MASMKDNCGSMDDRPQCVVCGLPDSVAKLLRLTWEGEYDILGDEPRLMLAHIPKVNDVMMCTGCLRGASRITKTCGLEV